MERLGFIGLGKMGLPMSQNLLKAGFPLVVHNRSKGPLEDFKNEPPPKAASPASVAENSDIVLTCLPDVPASEQVFMGENGLLSGSRPGQLFIDHSTVSPRLSRTIYEAAKSRGVDFLDAPVSGGPAGAAASTLTIMVGGEKAAFERATPVLKAMGQNVHHIGPPSSGTIIKLTNQLLVALHTLAVTEALVLTAKAGGDPKIALDVISTSFGSSAMLNRNGPMILERRFDPGTSVNLILKDLRLILDVAEEYSLPLEMGSLAEQMFNQASQLGLGTMDMAAMILPIEKIAKVQVKPKC